MEVFICMVCKKCKQDKPITEYYLYQGKPRTQCKVCLLNAARNRKVYKINSNIPNLDDKTIEVAVAGRKRKDENTPLKSITEDFSLNPDYKFCIACETWKPKTEYFVAYSKDKKRGTLFRRCKWCHNNHSREKAKLFWEEKHRTTGGSEKIISTAGKFVDKWQRDQTFWLMKLIGWDYNAELNIWTKKGIKELKDGKIVWIGIKEKPAAVKKEKLPNGERKYVDIEKLLFLKKCGWSLDKISKEINLSIPTVRERLKRYS